MLRGGGSEVARGGGEGGVGAAYSRVEEERTSFAVMHQQGGASAKFEVRRWGAATCKTWFKLSASREQRVVWAALPLASR